MSRVAGKVPKRKAQSCAAAMLLIVALAALPARAETPRGSYAYPSLGQCVAAQKLSDSQCANAAANAEAEFDEKAPRFRTRPECETRFRRGQCELGLKGSAGWSGQKTSVFFTPRQSGFRITVRSENDMTVVPGLAVRGLGFAPRSILRLQTSRSARPRREAVQAWRSGGAAGAAIGDERATQFPGPAAGPLPPPPVVDPNFDCASLLEPGSGPSSAGACYPVPGGRARR